MVKYGSSLRRTIEIDLSLGCRCCLKGHMMAMQTYDEYRVSTLFIPACINLAELLERAAPH